VGWPVGGRKNCTWSGIADLTRCLSSVAMYEPPTRRAKSPAVPISPRTSMRTLPASQPCRGHVDAQSVAFNRANARQQLYLRGHRREWGFADGQPEGLAPSSRAPSLSRGGRGGDSGSLRERPPSMDALWVGGPLEAWRCQTELLECFGQCPYPLETGAPPKSVVAPSHRGQS